MTEDMPPYEWQVHVSAVTYVLDVVCAAVGDIPEQSIETLASQSVVSTFSVEGAGHHVDLRKTWKREGENRLAMDGHGRHGPGVPHAIGVSDGSHSREYVVTKNARTTFQARLKWRRNGVCSAVVTVVLDRRFWRVQTSWERHVTISWPRQPRFDSWYGQGFLGAGRIAAVVEVAHEWCVYVGQQSVRSLLPSQDGHAPLGLSTGT